MIVIATAAWTVLLMFVMVGAGTIALSAVRGNRVRPARVVIVAAAIATLVSAGRGIAHLAGAVPGVSGFGAALTDIVLPGVIWFTAVTTLLLVSRSRAPRGVGVLALASALMAVGDAVQHRLGTDTVLPLVAWAAALAVLALPGRLLAPVLWSRLSGAVVVAGVMLIVAPLLPLIGVEINGARSWIRSPLGPIMPGEIGRLLLLLGTAGMVAQRSAHIDLVDARRGLLGPAAVRPLLISLAGVGVGIGMLAIQKDLGPALIVAISVGWVASVVTGRIRFAVAATIAITVATLLVLALLPRFQSRVDVWLAPLGPEPAALSQYGNAVSALAWAGWFGSGIGGSIQRTQPGIVTHADTDFALITHSAEAGLVGLLVVVFGLTMFAAFLWLGAARALWGGERTSPGPYAVAIAAMLSTHIAVNLASLFGVIPITGITTLFISGGGMSLVSTAVAVALAARWMSWTGGDPDRVDLDRQTDQHTRRRQSRAAVAAAIAVVLIVPSVIAGTRAMAGGAAVNASGMSPQQSVADATSLGTIRSADGSVLAETTNRDVMDLARRMYPLGDLASEVIGTVTPLGSATGAERALWPLLRCGTTGPLAADRRDCTASDVTITLDMRWQNAAITALDGRVGSVVVMRASTGEVLAAASSERVDPTAHTDRDVAIALDAARVEAAPGRWAALVPPGSVYKLAVLTAAFETWGEDVPFVAGRDCPDVSSIAYALAISCNSVFQSVAERLGAAAIVDVAQRLGFSPDSLSGIPLPTVDIDIETAVPSLVGIGQQDVRTTLIGVAAATATLAAGGSTAAPALLPAPTSSGDDDAVSPAVRAMVVEAMRAVVTDGTLSVLQDLPGAWAGKTGTSENGDGTANALVTAFPTGPWPASEPADIVISVLVSPTAENPMPVGGRDAGQVLYRVVSSYSAEGVRQ